ncbi:hypothetical protein MAUB_36690 [Mycolicibacterium aubagnense]|uniref:Uncharacterized protein n=1 Tax=Mycolicibacterium aubagnense TaxID=319707 RepID=A0ABM7IGL3_9MYCO|nr:hypothetical protein MAUB_36690 [Mycolicibacterium aubagnense]
MHGALTVDTLGKQRRCDGDNYRAARTANGLWPWWFRYERLAASPANLASPGGPMSIRQLDRADSLGLDWHGSFRSTLRHARWGDESPRARRTGSWARFSRLSDGGQ